MASFVDGAYEKWAQLCTGAEVELAEGRFSSVSKGVRTIADRCSGMQQRTPDQPRLATYSTQAATGLVAFGVIAATVHAYIAAAAIAVAVMVVVLITAHLLDRSGNP